MGNMIRDYRLANHMTQQELASRLGVRQSEVSVWERGMCYPRMPVCFAMAELFGVSLDVLLGRVLPYDAPKAQTALYAYGMRLRGFSPGCQPMVGLVDRLDYTGSRYCDVLMYNRRLTEQEVRTYELDYLYSVTGSVA